MTEQTFVSYGQNREDVVLWRALREVAGGRYVEVGANHPRHFSISRGFYDRGWSGVTVEPVPLFAALHRQERPRDTQVEAAITSADLAEITLHVIGDTGLSTLVDSVSAQHAASGWGTEDVTVAARRLDDVLDETVPDGEPVHFLVVDVEGAERQVLESVDLARWRPWVLVVEATAPLGARPTHGEWEDLVLSSGYRFCLFDGLSRFYVADEHADRLAAALSYPACPHDDYTTAEALDAEAERARLDDAREALLRQSVHWRTIALTQWADALARSRGVVPQATDDGAARELEAMRRTLSWRVTRPLRLARRVAGRVKRTLR